MAEVCSRQQNWTELAAEGVRARVPDHRTIRPTSAPARLGGICLGTRHTRRQLDAVGSCIKTVRRSHDLINSSFPHALVRRSNRRQINDGSDQNKPSSNSVEKTAVMQDSVSTCFNYLATCKSSKPTFNISGQGFVNRRKGDTVSAPRRVEFCNYRR